MNPKEWANKLNGRQYFSELSDDEYVQAKKDGIVIVVGAPDDCVELLGTFNDEVDCSSGGDFYVTENGVFWNDCQADDCPYYLEERKKTRKISAIWDSLGYSWLFETDIPHERFDIYDKDSPYCRGIVFSINQLGNEGKHRRKLGDQEEI